MSGPPPPSGLDADIAERLLAHRILVLGDELDQAAGNRLCAQLLLLSAADPRADVSLWINSPGGSVPAMLAIRDVMRMIPNDVSTLAMGMACSAGQFLLSAGARGKRYALPHAWVLLHQGSAGIGGVAQDVAIQADHLRHTRDVVLDAIAADTGQPRERVEADSRRDRWFTAAEAVGYGFVDRVVESVDDVRPVPARRAVGLAAAAAGGAA
jgi:ATP-dependent Clp protease, protease subunit